MSLRASEGTQGNNGDGYTCAAGGQQVPSRAERHAVDAALAHLAAAASAAGRPRKRHLRQRHGVRVHRQQRVALGAHRHPPLVQPRLSESRPPLNV